MKLLIILNQYKALRLAAIFSLIMLAIGVVGYVMDDRILLGESVWLKPIKFGVSIPIFCVTAAWLLSIMPYSKQLERRIDNLLGWTLVLEVPLIFIQAIRGVRSHFNYDSLFDGVLFASMGVSIAINSLALLFLFITSFVKELKTYPAMQRAIQLSGIAMVVSMVAGQIMIGNMGHSVGVPDGGEGMPITHWSTQGGDWRVVHFLGMHAFQLLPLLIYFLKDKVQEVFLIKVSWISGLLYIGIILFLFWITSLGIPLVS